MEHILHRPARRRRLGLAERLRMALALHRQRRNLRDLSDHIIDDIGLTREAADREASRPIWDVPATWRR